MDNYISRTDHHNPLDSQIISTKLKYGMTDLHKRTVCFFSYFNLLQITVHKHKGSDCSAFKIAVKNEYFVKVKVKGYSERMLAIEKYMCLLDDTHDRV